MNFVVDAQLPRRMVDWLTAAGGDAVHTLDLPNGNRSTDDQLIELTEREQRCMITKDADFVNSHNNHCQISKPRVLRARPDGTYRSRLNRI